MPAVAVANAEERTLIPPVIHIQNRKDGFGSGIPPVDIYSVGLAPDKGSPAGIKESVTVSSEDICCCCKVPEVSKKSFTPSARSEHIEFSTVTVEESHGNLAVQDILTHEIGHVCAKHGLQSIKKSRLVDAFRIIGQKAADKYGPQELAELTDIFEDALGDIAEKLIERGYDRKYEYEADELAVRYAARMRYDGGGLVDFLGTMVESDAGGSDIGWFKTHPGPGDRISRVQGKVKVFKRDKARTDRFKAAFKGLK